MRGAFIVFIVDGVPMPLGGDQVCASIGVGVLRGESWRGNLNVGSEIPDEESCVCGNELSCVGGIVRRGDESKRGV
jgi:hypothetical protein